MRAVVFDEPGDESVLRVADVPEPECGDEELRIRVAAAAVNRGDLMQRQGLYPAPPGASEVLGLECAGRVAEVGSKVEGGWQVGDRAMALLPGGGYAEQAVVHAGSVLRVPERLSLEEAAAVPEVFLTVQLCIFDLARLAAGDSLLVHGGGSGIGTAAIQLAKRAGARVAVTAGTEEKCQRCLELGADVAVNYRSDDWVAAARELGGGAGVDVVLDSIGAPYLEPNLSALAIGGRLVVIGLMRGAKAELSLGPLLVKRLSIIGSTLRARPTAEKAALVRNFEERFGGDLAEGRIRAIVDRVLPLEQASEAHRVMKASEHFGKIVLHVADV